MTRHYERELLIPANRLIKGAQTHNPSAFDVHPLALGLYARTKAEHELREHVHRIIERLDDEATPIYDETVRALRPRWWRDGELRTLACVIFAVAVLVALLATGTLT